MERWKILLKLALSAIVVVGCTFAQDPHSQPDETWVTIAGTVLAPAPNSFQLDYGDDQIIIEMDDWDWYPDASGLIEGDSVIVRGRIDADPQERTSIEASSVYLKGLNTYFYADPADEEGVSAMLSPMDRSFQATGTVTAVNDREFTLNTGAHDYTVDTKTMTYDPLDDSGFQQIKEGDRVKAIGKMTRDLFENWELKAAHVITLSRDSGKSGPLD